MKLSIRFLFIIASLLLSSVCALSNEYAPLKILITTTSGSDHTIEIGDNMNVRIGGGSLEIESDDSEFHMDIMDVKGFRYLTEGKPVDPSDDPSDTITEISESTSVPSKIIFENNEMHIFSDYALEECQVVNIDGITVFSNKFSGDLVLSLKQFAAGTYIIKLASGKTLKFLIK